MNHKKQSNEAAPEETVLPEDQLSEGNAAPTAPDETATEVCGDIMQSDASEPSASVDDASVKKIEIVGIRFRQSGKIYFFSPGDIQLHQGDGAIVETARGIEYGTVSISNRMVSEHQIVPPLRSVLRRATDEDTEHYRLNLEKETEAYNICLEKIENLHLEMKLVEVEYTFDNSKLLFYFTADGRVDFRDLVKYLAGVFRTRIELRQIGIRDEAKMRGGLGICGRPFCCGTFLNDFAQVSIKMAKEQNLSLNSSKISGTCGRLMCCLRYEYDTYVEELAKTPAVDAVVHTPDGDGYITEVSPLAGICRVKLLASPDAASKYYHRDDLQITGQSRKDVEAILIREKEEKEKSSESADSNKRSRRSSRKFDKKPSENHAIRTSSDKPEPDGQK